MLLSNGYRDILDRAKFGLCWPTLYEQHGVSNDLPASQARVSVRETVDGKGGNTAEQIPS